MIKIIFKNVGQGDSIIIEWEDEETKGIGIIDCNIYEGRNSILDHIKSISVEEINFIILSHPHYDHFSGFLQLLDYCRLNGVKIKYFIHTCSSIPSFIKSALKSVTADKEIAQLFKFLHTNYQKMGMSVGSIQSDIPSNFITLSKSYKLTFLSPSLKEIQDAIRGSNYNFEEESAENNPKANVLSTVIRIDTKEGYVLLTADAPKTTLYRIDKKNASSLDGELLLGQGPHHGADANHNHIFWKKRTRKDGIPVIFSVGPNTYGHVGKKTVDSFIENVYELYSTNEEGALRSVEKPRASYLLDIFSTKINTTKSNNQGDQEFTFE